MLPSMIWVAKNLYFFNCLLDGAHTSPNTSAQSFDLIGHYSFFSYWLI
jgi:hypothetical protein